MAAAIPAVIGGIIAQDQNRKANNLANRGLSMQEQAAARENALFDALMGVVKSADASGEFDPNKRIAQMNEDSFARQGMAENLNAGASRILGYRPGDSTPIAGLRGVSERFELDRRAQDNAIRNDAFNRRYNAYRGVTAPMGQAMVGQNLYNAGTSRQQDLSGFVSALMPFLQGQPRTQTQTVNPVFGSVPYQVNGYGYNSKPF